MMSPRPRLRNPFTPALLLAGALAVAPALQAQTSSAASLEQRLNRIERLLQSSGLMNMLEDVETLKEEVRNLRGELELQSHSVRQVQQHQRELYLDVDRRLQQVEGGGPGTALTGPAPAQPGTAMASTPQGARPLTAPPAAPGAAPFAAAPWTAAE